MQFYGTETWNNLSVNIDHGYSTICKYELINKHVSLLTCY